MELENREALDLWRDITHRAIKADGPDLSARQTALLLTIHLDEDRHTVRGLSKRLGLGKPAIVRALDSLQALGLVRRVRDETDRRNIFIEPTEAGAHRSDIAIIIAQGISNMDRGKTIEIRRIESNFANDHFANFATH
ncbi:MAG: MarR family transcriptional regulator [Hyphomonadaceae bacterium]|nr:MAG: MarR family transcriptional regulator [Hyphomonadaceae bacterium]